MESKNVLVTCGPIPARLDSVKFITNRFKGGLAFKTAYSLVDNGYNVTILCWKHTQVPLHNGKNILDFPCNVVTVLDVVEYYNWIESHATEFDAFVLAAAVANLMPNNPYTDKFPSHLYKVGDKFNVEFEIAPRAIDIVKKKNTRSCLIGYKLFDAKSDDELIDIARHTLDDSKANIIFANTPSTAKERKLALFQDNTVIECNFEEHLELIRRAIDSQYYTTNVCADMMNEMKHCQLNAINMCKELVRKFEETLTTDGDKTYGTIAIKVPEVGGFVTTSRGHKGNPVYVASVDDINRVIHADGKATLNAPALNKFIEHGFDYAVHKHEDLCSVGCDKYGKECDSGCDWKCGVFRTGTYLFPGTFEEAKVIDNILSGYNTIIERGHGYIKGFYAQELDWNKYYEIFGDTYSSYPAEIDEMITGVDHDRWLDVGCNTRTTAKYVIEPYVKVDGATHLDYSSTDKDGYFELITLKNSANYLSDDEFEALIKMLASGGKMVFNTFVNNYDVRVKDNEAVYSSNGKINHYIVNNNTVYKHQFRPIDLNALEHHGFTVDYYSGGKSALVTYTKP